MGEPSFPALLPPAGPAGRGDRRPLSHTGRPWASDTQQPWVVLGHTHLVLSELQHWGLLVQAASSAPGRDHPRHRPDPVGSARGTYLCGRQTGSPQGTALLPLRPPTHGPCPPSRQPASPAGVQAGGCLSPLRAPGALAPVAPPAVWPGLGVRLGSQHSEHGAGARLPCDPTSARADCRTRGGWGLRTVSSPARRRCPPGRSRGPAHEHNLITVLVTSTTVGHCQQGRSLCSDSVLGVRPGSRHGDTRGGPQKPGLLTGSFGWSVLYTKVVNLVLGQARTGTDRCFSSLPFPLPEINKHVLR